MRPGFIINGTLTGLKKITESIQQQFSSSDFIIVHTQHANHAAQLAAQLSSENCSHIVAVGGDGTLHQVINGVLSTANKYDGFVSILPYGTGNDFARAKGFQKSIEQLKHKMQSNKFEYCDCGYIKLLNDKREAIRYFVNVADTGFGAAVVNDMLRSKNIFGKNIQYTLSVLKTFLNYKKQHMEIITDNFTYQDKVLLTIVANSNFFGSGYHIAPMASTKNGMLELIIMGNISLMDYLLNLPKLRKGKLIQHPQVHYHTFKNPVVIKCSDSIFTEADGELIAGGNVQIGVIEKAFKLL